MRDDTNTPYERLLALTARGIQPGLERVRAALARLGRPEREGRWILVAGTNGKGSTAAFLGSMLGASGLHVGLYTSPHLIHPEERIQVDRRPVGRDRFEALADRVLALAEKDIPLTFFEALTCMAFCHFAEVRPDVTILEVGMGGRLDATNVVDPLLSVVTPIGMDHQQHLGSDILTIAHEKAGILRPGGAAAFGEIEPLVMRNVFGPIVREQRIDASVLGRDALYRWEGGLFAYRGSQMRFSALPLGIPGRYQAHNAALALMALEMLGGRGFRLRSDEARRGLIRARWPGRFDVIARTPPYVLDVAHNPHGVAALVEALQERYGARRFTVCVGVRADKDLSEMLRILAPVTRALVLAADPSRGLREVGELPRAEGDLFESVRVVSPVEEALVAVDTAHAMGDAVLVVGSHALVGAALANRAF